MDIQPYPTGCELWTGLPLITPRGLCRYRYSMSEGWPRDQRFHVDADGRNPEDFEPLHPGPLPYLNHQPYLYSIESARPASLSPFQRVGGGHPDPVENVDYFSQPDISNSQLTDASSSGYHDSRTVCDGPYAASYGFMSSSESKSHDYMNPATGPSFPYRRLHHNSLTPQRPSAPQFSDAYIPAGAAWPPSDSGYRYNDTYPLSVTDSVDNVPELDGQPRVIKQVVATILISATNNISAPIVQRGQSLNQTSSDMRRRVETDFSKIAGPPQVL
ncbi:hypothetical protein WG66_014945 [Moniliophthora roreri]|nr:hypothetical protein WG66_014945 [Moniliophthora roreri]